MRGLAFHGFKRCAHVVRRKIDHRVQHISGDLGYTQGRLALRKNATTAEDPNRTGNRLHAHEVARVVRVVDCLGRSSNVGV